MNMVNTEKLGDNSLIEGKNGDQDLYIAKMGVIDSVDSIIEKNEERNILLLNKYIILMDCIHNLSLQLLNIERFKVKKGGMLTLWTNEDEDTVKKLFTNIYQSIDSNSLISEYLVTEKNLDGDDEKNKELVEKINERQKIISSYKEFVFSYVSYSFKKGGMLVQWTKDDEIGLIRVFKKFVDTSRDLLTTLLQKEIVKELDEREEERKRKKRQTLGGLYYNI